MKLLLLSLFISSFLYSCEGRTQCMSVRGHVQCGRHSRPGEGGLKDPVFVRLIDEDTGGPDDLMDEGFASTTGAFQLYGCASDGPLGGHIEPMIRIFHKCKGTPKRFTVEIPVEAIGKEYNLTTHFDLKGPLQNEKDEKYPVPKCGKKRFYLF